MPAEQEVKQRSITEEDVLGVIADLKELAKRPKRLTARDTVQRAYPQICAALELGYTLADICTVMERRGIKLAPSSLKRYLDSHSLQNKKRSIAEVGGQPISSLTPITEPSEPEVVTERMIACDAGTLASVSAQKSASSRGLKRLTSSKDSSPQELMIPPADSEMET